MEQQITLENAITRFRASNRDEAKAKLAAMFDDPAGEGLSGGELLSIDPPGEDASAGAESAYAAELLAKARRLLASAPSEDADEMREIITNLQRAIDSSDTERAGELAEQLEDLVFYLEDA